MMELFLEIALHWKPFTFATVSSILGRHLHAIYNHSQGIWGRLWFSCEIAHYGKGLIFVFEEFFC